MAIGWDERPMTEVMGKRVSVIAWRLAGNFTQLATF